MGKQLTMNQLFGDKIVGMGEPHLACALLLDTSGSMADSGAIDSLNEGVRRFKENVAKDDVAARRVDVSIVTFDTNVEVVCDFVPITKMPTVTLQAGGITEMARGIQKAIDLVEERTAMYQALGTPCHKPWIFMITDGASMSSVEEMRNAARRIKDLEMNGSHGSLSFWALGVDEYDAEELFSLTDKVIELKNEDFTGIFDWLSDSFSTISRGTIGMEVNLSELPPNAKEVQRDRRAGENRY